MTGVGSESCDGGRPHGWAGFEYGQDVKSKGSWRYETVIIGGIAGHEVSVIYVPRASMSCRSIGLVVLLPLAKFVKLTLKEKK